MRPPGLGRGALLALLLAGTAEGFAPGGLLQPLLAPGPGIRGLVPRGGRGAGPAPGAAPRPGLRMASVGDEEEYGRRAEERGASAAAPGIIESLAAEEAQLEAEARARSPDGTFSYSQSSSSEDEEEEARSVVFDRPSPAQQAQEEYLRRRRAEETQGVSSEGRLEEIANFAIRTTFSSPVYVGMKDLHFPLPLPSRNASYPAWIPRALRAPDVVYSAVDAAVDRGLLGRAPEGGSFEIRYGLLRALREPEAECDECEAARRAELRGAAEANMTNIGDEERERRRNVGRGLAIVAGVNGAICIANDAGPLTRFTTVVLPGSVAYAFAESGRTGTGMKEIEDPALARAMRDKVNNFNAQKAREILPPALLFTFFPFKTVKRALGF